MLNEQNALHQHLNKAFSSEDTMNENDEPQMLLPFEAAQALINAVKQVAAKDDKYWDIHQLAEYIGVSKATVERHFTNDPRWPKPIQWGSQGRRWLSSECRKALLLFRKD